MFRRTLITITLIGFLFLLPLRLTESLRNATIHFFKPIGSALIRQNLNLTNIARGLEQLPQLRQQNQTLQQEVLTLQQEVADQESLRRENQSLHQELSITASTQSLPKAFAHVVVQGGDLLDRTFTVDAGTNQKVQLGQPVIYRGTLIGRVITVRSSSAVVRAITSPKSFIQVWVAENREKGLLEGDGNSVFLAEVTQGVSIKPSNVVETSGLGGSLPQGILVGSVGPQVSRQSDLSQKFLLNLPQDPGSAETVFILLTEGQ